MRTKKLINCHSPIRSGYPCLSTAQYQTWITRVFSARSGVAAWAVWFTPLCGFEPIIKRVMTVVVLCVLTFPAFAADKNKAKESIFDRVMRTGTIQCGYILYEPVVIKDPNTGEMSGIVVEIMQEIAKRAGTGFKIEWTTESSYGTFAEDIKRSNVDLMCATLWTMADVGLHGTSTTPLWYSGLGAFIRAGESRFATLSDLNDENTTISSMDGSISEIIATQDFPKAKVLSLPHMNDYSVQLMNVVNGKADATFLEVNVVAEFLENNSGTLKNLVPNNPMRVYSNSLLVRKDEQEILNFINMALIELINEGFVDKLIDKYEAYPGSLYRVAKPYEVK